jgi:hypothetical protein
MKTSKIPRARRRHTIAHLRSLTGSEAVLVAGALQRLIDAIWRAHGDQMADVIGRDHPAPETLQPREHTTSFVDATWHDDDEIPF